MSATRKTKNLKLRRKLARIVAAQRKLDRQIGPCLAKLKLSVSVIDKMKPALNPPE